MPWSASRTVRSVSLATWKYLNKEQAPEVVPWRPRLLVAIVVAVLATVFAYHQLEGRAWLASDFEYDLRAARRLLDGLNPYNDPTARYGLPYPFDAQFPYPLIAAMVAVPFTAFTSYVGGALYVGAISGLMAFAVTREGWWRMSLFLSPCYFVAASVANWSPLLVASAFLPALFPFALAKPTMFLAIGSQYPNARGFALCVGIVILSLLVFPSWPIHWLDSVMNQPGGKYQMPIMAAPVMLVVLVGLLWWRTNRSARLLLLLSFIPQHPFFYDQLLLWLLPKTLGQSLALSFVGWLAYLSWMGADPAFKPLLAYTPAGPGLDWTAPRFFLPALVLVAWQAFAEARSRRVPVPNTTAEGLAPVGSFE